MSRGPKPRPRPRPTMRPERVGGKLRFVFAIHRPAGCDPLEPCSLTEEDARAFLRTSQARFHATVRERLAKYRSKQKTPSDQEST